MISTSHNKFSLLSLPWLLLLSTSVSATATILPPRLALDRQTARNNFKTTPATIAYGLETFYYTQRVDHFNYRPDSYITFRQKYLVNSRYWGGASANTSSPIFVWLGAEAPIDEDVGAVGFILEKAPEFKALIVYIEHRYYGESLPFGDSAFDNTSTLGYFTCAQALADYAEVLVNLKKSLSAEACPVIVMGGSYGGMLASWFRLKYPHIATGALASSAPILYFEDVTPHDQYYVVASNNYKQISKNCYTTIRKSWSMINKIASQANGLSLLSKKFKTCKPINSTSDLTNYLEKIYVYSAQYDSPPTYPVKQICDGIDRASKGSTTDILTSIVAGFVALQGNQSCYDLDENSRLTPADFGWIWQTCTDLILPIGRDRDNTMFPVAPFNLESTTQFCRDVFDDTVTPRPHWILTQFGGRDIKLVLKKFGSNIIFSNGGRDPYSSGGVLHNISHSVVAVYSAQASHALDILISSKDDPQWLIDMRKAEVEIIKAWIAEYYEMHRRY